MLFTSVRYLYYSQKLREPQCPRNRATIVLTMVTSSLQRFLSTFQILPALLPLRLRRPDHAGWSDPGQFYWLSSHMSLPEDSSSTHRWQLK